MIISHRQVRHTKADVAQGHSAFILQPSSFTEMNTTRLPSLSSLPLAYKGKVREVYDASPEMLLLVTSQRVSAYDVVFPEPVPQKGEVLNLLSAYWFERTRHIVENHLVETRAGEIFAEDAPERNALRGRVALVRRTQPIRFECVVRGHLDGSAWREYRKEGSVVGYKLPKGLERYDKLPKPIFTPATKAESGHDINVPVEYMASMLGDEMTRRLQATSLALYSFVYEQLEPRGVLLLDTKFEFGIADGELRLIDEIFTPDSSRYRLVGAGGGGEALALDKQYLRDWLAERGFTGEGKPPALPAGVIEELGRRYERAFEVITGESLDKAMEERG